MFGNINVINPEPVIQAFQDLSCGKTRVAQINSKDIELEAYETQPLEGFEFPTDFPVCCENHKQLFQHGLTALSTFPNCCESHKKLNSANWFDKSKYSYLPDKLVKTVTYTIHAIRKYLNAPSWYKLITDYIELTVKSYGQFPDGYGSPLGLSQYEHNVKLNIQTMSEISEDKKKLLLSYFDLNNQSESPLEKTDLNIVIAAYQKWLKLFPFELHSYFGELKDEFYFQLPLLTGKVEVNSHTGIAKGKLHTKASLIDFLMELTNTLLTQINGSVLLEKGVITNAQKIQVELLTQERKQKIKEGYKNQSIDEEQRYRKMIKDWLYDERIFWKKLEPVLSNRQDPKEASTKLDFQVIDNDLFTFNKVPFEIRFIYNRKYNHEGGQRFIEFKDSEYHFFTDYNLYHCFIDDWKEGKLFTDYLEPLSNDNIKQYYKAYSEGFLKGYCEFDEKIKSSTAVFQNDQNAIITKVFESAIAPSIGLPCYGSEWLNGKLVETIEKKIWFDTGVKSGEIYKAWFFIINNPSYFISQFRTHKPFISFYKRGVSYWKEQRGGEGMHSRLIQLLQEIGEPLDEDVSIEENNFLISTIEDYLDPFKNYLNADYQTLIQALKSYFETGKFPKLSKEIRVVGKVNVKKLGWALKEVYRSQKSGRLPIEYVEFGKRNISVFTNVPFDKKKFTKCRLYKYYTSKPQ